MIAMQMSKIKIGNILSITAIYKRIAGYRGAVKFNKLRQMEKSATDNW